MIKFSFISAFSIFTVFSQETESSLINNNDTLNVAIQKTDSLEVDTTEASLNDVMNSIDINTNEQLNDKADTLNTVKPLPIVRDPGKKLSLIHI